MPSGSTHNKINFLFLPAFLLLLVLSGFGSFKYAFIFSIGFVFGTLFLDPDLDTRGKSFRRWGIFKFIWIPYQRTFPHRSVFTHGIIIGDIIRIAYLMGWLMLMFYIPTFLVNSIIKPLYKLYFSKHDWSIGVFIIILVISIISLVKYGVKNNSQLALSLILILVMILDSTNVFSLYEWVLEHYKEDYYSLWFTTLGIVLSSALHVTSDILVSSLKKILK
ncbi:DUF2227 family putative metal-binding protein [Bacillus cereus]|uniref:DUF2227 family putative metal-binding protein n=1 Tax=Bacillus cereus TaxID=1396 RepID=UPI0030792843